MIKQKINVGQLQRILQSIPSHRFVTITTETDVRMNKRNNPYYDNIRKRCTANCSINFSYENVVNNRREKEGNDQPFTASERKWGQKVDNKFVVKAETNGDVKEYVALNYKSKPSNIEYIRKSDGSEIAYEEFAAYIPEKKSNAEHQGLSADNEVIYRNVKLGNIKELKVDGNHYIVG